MGIKGLYNEIGPGERISLTKLSIDFLEKNHRPLKLGIDFSIWQFQCQSGKGGSNPVLRTLYFRLLRLLSLYIRPIFIFDGPNRPPFKRNKQTFSSSISSVDSNTKDLLRLFGFPFHTAPGEAEAECALLQKNGIVDAVLSADIDTLMFGCGLTIRGWPTDGKGDSNHVTVYQSQLSGEGSPRLGREEMILVALMSGGDYLTEGIPGCGIKVACEAARAGYGKSLCRIPRTDAVGLKTWRKELANELKTNKHKFFRVKHKALHIPDTFPNMEVLGYYTHPVVSSPTRLENLKEEIKWGQVPDIPGLRVFVARIFSWTHKMGARKFIRGLAPAMLVSKLQFQFDQQHLRFDENSMDEGDLVKEILGKRQHWSTGGVPELRLKFRPIEVVLLDLDAEVDEDIDQTRDGHALLGDDGVVQVYHTDDDESRKTALAKTEQRGRSIYDPTEFDMIWVPMAIATMGIPHKVNEYDRLTKNSRRTAASKPVAKRSCLRSGMPNGAMHRYVTVTKPGSMISTSQNSKDLRKFPSDEVGRLNIELGSTSKQYSALQSTSAVSREYSQSVARKNATARQTIPVSKSTRPEISSYERGVHSRDPWSIDEVAKEIVIEASSSPPTVSVPVDKIMKSQQELKQSGHFRGSSQQESKSRFVMLRESLEGSWKEVTDGDVKPSDKSFRARKWRASGIEVLDMTDE